MDKIKVGIIAILTASAVLLAGCEEYRHISYPPPDSYPTTQSSSLSGENFSSFSGTSSKSSYDTYSPSKSEPVSSSYPASSAENTVESSSENTTSSSYPASSSAFSSASTASSLPVSSSVSSIYSSSSSSVSSQIISPLPAPSRCEESGHTAVTDEGVVPTCTVKGLSHGMHCSVCQEVLKRQYELPSVHIFLPVKIEYPSENTSGKAEFECIGEGCKTHKYKFDYQTIPTQQDVYDTLISFKSTYAEGSHFDNDSPLYTSKTMFPNTRYIGKGCAAFAFELSDAAFGDWPGRIVFDFSQIRVGDIIRLSNNEHSVIVLAVNNDDVTVAEANYNGAVHWGRTIKLSEAVNEWNYVITRYPELP
ncbi:MAG: hypothetical protein J1F03_08140 [Oscillospiraceae bacterium]|nr:hypothetical protein [Oscillospiraceae bacterium]